MESAASRSVACVRESGSVRPETPNLPSAAEPLSESRIRRSLPELRLERVRMITDYSSDAVAVRPARPDVSSRP